MRRFVILLLCGCSGGADEPVDTDLVSTTVEVGAHSFGCMTDMTAVRRFRVDNLLGDLEASLAVAEAAVEGSTYPAGTVLQLVPTEAMVKREAGFSALSNDWEFFFLATSEGGTEIVDRGVEGVLNAFNGDCFACHAAASAAWDYVCETGHGCVDLPIGADAIAAIQEADPRCP